VPGDITDLARETNAGIAPRRIRDLIHGSSSLRNASGSRFAKNPTLTLILEKRLSPKVVSAWRTTIEDRAQYFRLGRLRIPQLNGEMPTPPEDYGSPTQMLEVLARRFIVRLHTRRAGRPAVEVVRLIVPQHNQFVAAAGPGLRERKKATFGSLVRPFGTSQNGTDEACWGFSKLTRPVRRE